MQDIQQALEAMLLHRRGACHRFDGVLDELFLLWVQAEVQRFLVVCFDLLHVQVLHGSKFFVM